MRDEERRGQNQSGRRYFDVVFGIGYTVVARDEEHVMLLMRETFDYENTLADDGPPQITELTPEKVATRRLYDDSGSEGPFPIVDFPLGTVASSEF